MNSAEARALRDGGRAFGIEIEPDAAERIGRFLDVLSTWNERLRLTAERDVRLIIERHVLDSLAAVPYLPVAGLTVDLGSGGGFPGIILGCVRPGLDLVLLDARRRKVSFLREAIRTIPLGRARAVELRAEAAATDPDLAVGAALVVGRGLRLDVFLTLAAPLLGASGRIVAMQTPGTAADAQLAGGRRGLRLVDRHDYALPGHRRRSILLYADARVS